MRLASPRVRGEIAIAFGLSNELCSSQVRLSGRKLPQETRVAEAEAALLDAVMRDDFANPSAKEGEAISGASASVDAGPDFEGPYRALSMLGRGAMGTVWAAEHEENGRVVAIKVLSVQGDDALRRRFEREAKIAAALRHPNIVQIIDVGRTAGAAPTIVMELLKGQPLSDFLGEDPSVGKHLTWVQIQGILLQLCGALDCAHQSQVIHRDLKPSNIVILDDEDKSGNESLRCKVIDFGLAKYRPELDSMTELSRSGQVLGSPPYMSPEQFRGTAADTRSDVYALGCIMYRMIAGRAVFGGTNFSELMYAHCFVAPPTLVPSSRLSEMPEGRIAALQGIVSRALAKSPAERFQSMEEFAAALCTVDESAARHLRRRRSRWVGVAAAILVALGLGGGLAFRLGGDEATPDERGGVMAATPVSVDQELAPPGASSPRTNPRLTSTLVPAQPETAAPESATLGREDELEVGLMPSSGPSAAATTHEGAVRPSKGGASSSRKARRKRSKPSPMPSPAPVQDSAIESPAAAADPTPGALPPVLPELLGH